MNIARTLLRYGLRALLVVVGLLILLLLLIQLPFVQRELTGRLETYLEERLETTVQIDGIRFSLPSYLQLEGIYLEDRQRDTLLYLNRLRADFRWRLLRQRILAVDQLELRGLRADLHPDQERDSVMNYQFIAEAFGSEGPPAEEAPTEGGESSELPILLDDARLLLEDIRLYYEDPAGASIFDIRLGHFQTHTRKADLKTLNLDFREVTLSNTAVALTLLESTAPTDTTAAEPLPLNIRAGSMELKQIDFDLKMPELALGTSVGEIVTQHPHFRMFGDSMTITTPTFTLRESAFRYDVPSADPIEGFDYNHMAIDSIEIDLRDVSYRNLDIRGDILQVAGRDKSGMDLRQVEGELHYNPEELFVENLQARTAGSSLRIPRTHLDFVVPDTTMGLETIILESTIAPREMVLFAPTLGELDAFRQNIDRPLRLKGQLQGTLGDLDIRQIRVNGWDSRLRLDGRLQNTYYPDRLRMDLQLAIAEIRRAGLESFLPPNTLPAGTRLPEMVSGQVNLGGSLDSLGYEVDLQSARPLNPAALVLRSHGRLLEVMDSSRIAFNLRLDTLFVTRESVMGYLPAGALPAPERLPATFDLRGRADGDLASITGRFQMRAEGPERPLALALAATVDDWQEPDRMRIDLRADSLQIPRNTLRAVVADSLLPAEARLPYVADGRVKLRGQSTDLQAEVFLNTSLGLLETTGQLRDSSYQLRLDWRELPPAALLQPAAYDSLFGRPLSKLHLRAQLEGEGFSPGPALKSDFEFALTPTDSLYNWRDALRLSGSLQNNTFTAQITADEPGLRTRLEAKAVEVFGDQPLLAQLSLNLRELNLYALGFTDNPLNIATQMKFLSRGSDPEDFDGNLAIRNLRLRYDTVYEQLDSLVLTAALHPEKNTIDLDSDLATGFLIGQFALTQVAGNVQQLIRSYFDPRLPQDTIIGHPEDYFNFSLQLRNTSLLTSGLIPGLKKLRPVSIEAGYRAKSRVVNANILAPKIGYAGIELDTLGLSFRARQDTFRYDLAYRRLQAFDQVDAINFSLSGRLEKDKRVRNTLRQIDEKGRTRYLVENLIRRDSNTLLVEMAPDAILNYQDWQFDRANRLLIAPSTVNAQRWRFTRNQQAIILENPDSNTLDLRFSEFDLALLGNTISSEEDYLAGILDGKVRFRNPMRQLRLQTDLSVIDLRVLKARLGDLVARAEQDQKADWRTRLRLVGRGNDLLVKGRYQPSRPAEALQLDLRVDSLQLARIEPLTFGQAKAMQGILEGGVQIRGSVDNPRADGEWQFRNAQLRPALQQVTYRVGGRPLRMQSRQLPNGRFRTTIDLAGLSLTDPGGNQIGIEGELTTTDFTRFGLNLDVAGENILVLDTEKKDNDLYYGRLRTDLSGRISGSSDSTIVVLNINNRADSRLVYNYTVDALQMVESGKGVIEFIDPADTLERIRRRESQNARPLRELGWDVTLNASIDDELALKVITDPISGDFFEGSAEGDLALRTNSQGDINLSGGLSVKDGTYRFSYTELVKRTFKVVEGSEINWVGDPYDPQLNLAVRYATKANPAPLVAQFQGELSPTQKQELQGRQQFYVVLTVTGSLEELELGTSIEYPDVPLNTNNSDIQSAVARVNQNESQANSQAFGLLLFNGFILGGNTAGSSSVINVQQSFSDLLTNYLNNLATQYIGFVDLNFEIESEGGGAASEYFSTTDFRVSLEKSFLNDRLQISVDGVARGSDEQRGNGSSQAYLDNITVSYILTKSGALRIRIFNRREISEFLGGEVVKLGGALVFSKDFDRLELFGGKRAAPKREN